MVKARDFPFCFRIEKKIRHETVLKAKKNTNSTLFGCANLSPSGAMKVFELPGNHAYSLSLPYLLPSLNHYRCRFSVVVQQPLY
jgi:hypothetical protein